MTVQYNSKKWFTPMRVYYTALQDDGSTAITDTISKGAVVCWDEVNGSADEAWLAVSQCDAGHAVPAGIVAGVNADSGAQWIDIIPFGQIKGQVLVGLTADANVADGDTIGTKLASFALTDTNDVTSIGTALETNATVGGEFAFRELETFVVN